MQITGLFRIGNLIKLFQQAIVNSPDLDSLSVSQLKIDLNKACSAAQYYWASASFIALSDRRLSRYFSFELRTITTIWNNLTHSQQSLSCHNRSAQVMDLFSTFVNELHQLVAYLKEFYSRYLEQEIIAGVDYQQFFIRKIFCSYYLPETPAGDQIDMGLYACLGDYFQQMKEGRGIKFSYSELWYFERLIANFSTHVGNVVITRFCEQTLIDLNFNRIEFFLYLQQQIRTEITDCPTAFSIKHLKQQLSQYNARPAHSSTGYRTQWPSLVQMMRGWLKEEIREKEQSLIKELKVNATVAKSKLAVNLSVPQLAFLLRLFCEENLYPNCTLTEIFQFTARHYRTKRQSHISVGSISKNYYSADQFTASQVRGLLQNIITKINRKFFPVVVAAGAAFLLA